MSEVSEAFDRGLRKMEQIDNIPLRPATREDFTMTVRKRYKERHQGRVVQDVHVCFEYAAYGKDFWVKQPDGELEHHQLLAGMETSFAEKLEAGVVMVIE